MHTVARMVCMLMTMQIVVSHVEWPNPSALHVFHHLQSQSGPTCHQIASWQVGTECSSQSSMHMFVVFWALCLHSWLHLLLGVVSAYQNACGSPTSLSTLLQHLLQFMRLEAAVSKQCLQQVFGQTLPAAADDCNALWVSPGRQGNRWAEGHCI